MSHAPMMSHTSSRWLPSTHDQQRPKRTSIVIFLLYFSNFPFFSTPSRSFSVLSLKPSRTCSDFLEASLIFSNLLEPPRTSSNLLGPSKSFRNIKKHSKTIKQVGTSRTNSSIGLLDPRRELIGDSEIAYFSSFNAIYVNNEPN